MLHCIDEDVMLSPSKHDVVGHMLSHEDAPVAAIALMLRQAQHDDSLTATAGTRSSEGWRATSRNNGAEQTNVEAPMACRALADLLAIAKHWQGAFVQDGTKWRRSTIPGSRPSPPQRKDVTAMCHHNCSDSVHGISRRDFLVGAAVAAAAGPYLLRAASAQEAARRTRSESPADWPEVKVAYLRPRDKYWLGWPGTAWDKKMSERFLTQSRNRLEQLAKELRVRLEFQPQPLYDETAVNAFVQMLSDKKPSGVVVFPLHMDRWGHVRRIAEAGVPTVIYAALGMCFTGHIAGISRQPGVHLISSPDPDLNPLRFGIKLFRSHHDVRNSRIAVLAGDRTNDEVLEPFGLRIRRLPRKRFADAFNAVAETGEVKAMVEDYRKAADKIVEPSQADLVNASRAYFAAQRIMREEDCNGITMDCLGAVFERQIPGPPCLAWSRLLDAGIPAICEADINAVMSHTLCCRLLDKPGFMQDPVPETVHNTFIGAHCVCPTRLNGYDKPREKFILRSHAESDVGVSVQVLWRSGQPVTLMQFVDPGRMILGRGKVLRNHHTPPMGGCRTSVELALEGPADTRDTKGFHQLFIYGDHVRDFQAYGQMYGIVTEAI